MTSEKKGNEILTLLYLEILTGDYQSKAQYLPTVLTMLEVELRAKIEPHKSAISRFRKKLYDSARFVIFNNFPTALTESTREKDIERCMKLFAKYIIVINEQVADEVGLVQIELIQDIESVVTALNLTSYALQYYSEAMAGSPGGLDACMRIYGEVLHIIIPIAMKYELVSITASDMTQSMLAAERKREEKRRAAIPI